MEQEEHSDAKHREEMERLSLEYAERSMAAKSDAVIGLVGAVIIAVSGIMSGTVEAIAIIVGLCGVAFFIRGLSKRWSFWSILLGVPTAGIILWKLASIFKG